MQDYFITIENKKIIKRKKGWQYKIIVQPERNDIQVNINIKGKRGLWAGSLVKDKIVLKFKGKNDKEQKKYGDCELLFTNQFYREKETDTAKLDDKKDKIFEKIVSEYAKHTKQENKINLLIAELSNTQKKAEEEKKKKELLLAQKKAEEERKKQELLLAQKKAEEEKKKEELITKLIAEEKEKLNELELAKKEAEKVLKEDPYLEKKKHQRIKEQVNMGLKQTGDQLN